MRAVVVHETGGPDVLRDEGIDRPEPRDGEVLLRVRAASVNPVDWKRRRGIAETPLPAVLGSDVSGTVETSRADGYAAGDDVFGMAASPGGVLVTIAAAPPEAAARERGVRAELLVMSPDPAQLTDLTRLVADGAVRIEIAEVLPLSEVRRAHELIESGHTRGKIVLVAAG
jgi:NADPH:quinone reductase-like Zn-dependent oxidoreductase